MKKLTILSTLLILAGCSKIADNRLSDMKKPIILIAKSEYGSVTVGNPYNTYVTFTKWNPVSFNIKHSYEIGDTISVKKVSNPKIKK